MTDNHVVTIIIPTLNEEETIANVIRRIRPHVIVNAAAWTAVDLAEDEPARAHTVNAIAPAALKVSLASAGGRST